MAEVILVKRRDYVMKNVEQTKKAVLYTLNLDTLELDETHLDPIVADSIPTDFYSTIGHVPVLEPISRQIGLNRTTIDGFVHVGWLETKTKKI